MLNLRFLFSESMYVLVGVKLFQGFSQKYDSSCRVSGLVVIKGQISTSNCKALKAILVFPFDSPYDSLKDFYYKAILSLSLINILYKPNCNQTNLSVKIVSMHGESSTQPLHREAGLCKAKEIMTITTHSKPPIPPFIHC